MNVIHTHMLFSKNERIQCDQVEDEGLLSMILSLHYLSITIFFQAFDATNERRIKQVQKREQKHDQHNQHKHSSVGNKKTSWSSIIKAKKREQKTYETQLFMYIYQLITAHIKVHKKIFQDHKRPIKFQLSNHGILVFII